jgi:hypothetical protein
MIIKGNLQEKQLILLTYITILAMRLFQIFIAIIAYFNLKIKQFDIINAFANAKRLISSVGSPVTRSTTRSQNVVC